MSTSGSSTPRVLVSSILTVIVTVSAVDARETTATRLQPTEKCLVPAEELRSDEDILFDHEQETYLGEIVSSHLDRSFRRIRNPELNERLQRIGDRLMAEMSAEPSAVLVRLIDPPQANAFALPGARIYVSRKLVALTRSEDELAGVIAHELGHALGRHAAIEVSHAVNKLEIESVSTREEIRAAYHRIVDVYERNPRTYLGTGKGRNHQLAADRAAIFATARAGFSPFGYADFWDRMAETEGRDGNWFSDFMGAIRADEKRLREMQHLARDLPAECLGARSDESEEPYDEWRARVVAYDGSTTTAHLPGLAGEAPLTPAARTAVEAIRFSPDGRFALTHDRVGAVVSSLDPPTTLFRIDAAEDAGMLFSLDSRSVFVYDRSLRVERYDIEGRARTDVHELYIRRGCLDVALSKDGAILACVTRNLRDWELTIRLLDVTSGAELFRKPGFYSA